MAVTEVISKTFHKQKEVSQKKMFLWKRRMVNYFKRPTKSCLDIYAKTRMQQQ